MKGTQPQSLEALFETIKNLSESEQSVLTNKIMGMLSQTKESHKRSFQEELVGLGSEKPNCPHCGAKATMGWVVKNGFDKGSQRYLCKACGKKFFSTTGTAFARTRKDSNTWRKFIQLTINGKSLKACCVECKIAYQTAFTWRHKVLNAFVANQDELVMGGTVEVDEMLIPISYKGNHVKGGFSNRKRLPGVDNGLPRESYKRGTDNKSTSAKEKACVFCMVENGNKSYYAAVPGVGFMLKDMLNCTVGKHVDKRTALILADNYKVSRKYFEDNGYNHVILSSNTSDNPHDHKPEIKGELHMQHVNSMHRHLRRFLAGYCGVSSKYLENYVALYVWLKSIEFSKRQKGAEQASVSRAAVPDCYITRKNIESRPAIPMCA